VRGAIIFSRAHAGAIGVAHADPIHEDGAQDRVFRQRVIFLAHFILLRGRPGRERDALCRQWRGNGRATGQKAYASAYAKATADKRDLSGVARRAKPEGADNAARY
jgi:hypothetical protein